VQEPQYLISKGASPSILEFLERAKKKKLGFFRKLQSPYIPLNLYLDTHFRRSLLKGKLDSKIDQSLLYMLLISRIVIKVGIIG
jgi:hypothetical protein